MTSLQAAKDDLEKSLELLGGVTKKSLTEEIQKVNERLGVHEEKHKQLDQKDEETKESLAKADEKFEDKHR